MLPDPGAATGLNSNVDHGDKSVDQGDWPGLNQHAIDREHGRSQEVHLTQGVGSVMDHATSTLPR